MAGEYVKVDLQLLETTATSLGRIANDLSASRASAEADAAVLAQPELTAALAEFSDNWKLRRENLITSVQGAHKFVTGAVGCYRKLDAELAAACTVEQK